MIAVYATKRRDHYRLYVEGHAGSDGEGKLVCAAVSALTGALLHFAKERAACRHCRTSVEGGRAFLSCHGGLSNAFEMTVSALAELAEAYPAHMKRPILSSDR